MDVTVSGLSSDDVRERIKKGQVNEIPDESAKTVKQIILENTLTYFNGIFLLLAVLLIIAGSYNSLTFLPVIICNTLIGIAQEIYAKKVLDQLSVMSASKASVIRDGEEREISIDQLVRDDCIRLKGGMQIPADAVLIDGRLSVNESLLTGESDEIEKLPGHDNVLKSGSFVVSGDGYAVLTAVGSESYISKLTVQAKSMSKHENSEMVRSIDILVKAAGIIIIPIGIIMFLQSYVMSGQPFKESITSMVAAVIGMIPEGLYLLLSVALAMSSIRLARKQVVLHDMHSIETLAHVDVLCVDKTGTITDNEMTVDDCVTIEELSSEESARREQLLGAYLKELPDNNITMQALRNYFRIAGHMTVISTTPFSSANKYSEVRASDAVYRLGAPDIILKNDKSAEEVIRHFAALGERVLVFAASTEGSEFKPLLFIALKNGIRKNVEKTFKYFKEQGVNIRVISGDNPETVSNIAISVGIEGAEHYTDCSRINSRREMVKAVHESVVFGRVKPEQKKEIVQILKQDGSKVAMTGDGVNDILAMKEADCSIAMGNGSDAARQAAQVVLLDSDFNRMTSIVSEGRRDMNNINRSATLFLVKNMFSLFLSIFTIINVMTYPLQPTQISLISMFNIGIPAFFLAFEPNNKRQSRHFLLSVIIRAFPAALTDFLMIAAMVVFCNVFGISSEDLSIASTFLLAIVGFMILINISSPLNTYRIVVITGCVIGLIITAIFFNNLFDIHYVSVKCIMLFTVFAIAEEPIMRYLTRFFTWIYAKAERKGIV